MRISVVVATYNGETHIRNQLESIFNQTLTPDEVVISDDGSTDGTRDIIKEFEEKYPDIVRVDFHGEGLGANGNSGHSLEQATGDLIAMADQDDVWHTQKLEKQVQAFEKYPDLALSCHNLMMTDSELEPIAPYWGEFGFDPRDFSSREELIRQITPVSCLARPSMMIPDWLVPLLNPPAPPEWFHDHHIALVAATQGPIHFLTKPLVKYRQHNNNVRGGPEGKSLFDHSKIYMSNRGEVNGTPAVRAKRWKQAHSRMDEYSPDELNGYKSVIVEEINKHIKYHRSRMEILDDSYSMGHRLSVFLQLLGSSSYRTYSRGFRSACKDLIEIFRQDTIKADPPTEIEKLCL